MIKDTNKQIGIVVDDNSRKKLDKMCKENNLSKSVVIGVALAVLFKGSEKFGYKIADEIIRVIDVDNQPVHKRSKPSDKDFEYLGSLEDV